MRYIDFGTTHAQASEIMLGLLRLNETAEAQADAVFGTAIDSGINMIDTASCYPESEERIGRLFRRHPGMRDKLLVQTKVGIRRHGGPEGAPFPDCFSYFDFSYEHIVTTVDKSLQLMGIDYVDSLLLHRPDVLMEPEEVARAFEDLHAAGKVINFGVSNQNVAMMRRLAIHVPFPLVANQVQLSPAFAPAFEAMLTVNMDVHAATMREDGIFEYACEHDQAIQAWSPLQKGMMEGCYIGDPEYAELNAALERIAEAHDTNPAAVAVAWNQRFPCKMQSILGSMVVSEIRDEAHACDFELTRPEWYEIYQAAGRRVP